MISLYQAILSPDHGPLKHVFKGGFCRYRPSCSDYSKMSIKRYGLFKGGIKGAWRILRCNPWSKGGLDLP
ncbi:membrane protein insertion efficiency factor YidD [Candidatus Peregrinibacteria bacterium CG2_30_44_17]|nr:MAG: membrane protein insertion efficiency factor YidD [Candidatus Peregrinibacteria bacterium CG2_30_44_17]